MQFVILGFLVVLLIGFFVVVWKAAVDWRWYNIVAVCFIMILAMLFLFPTAGVLRSRSAWHELKERLEKRAEEAHAENRLIKYGDPTDAQYGEGVIDLDKQLAKLNMEAGRRWPNLVFQGAANGKITLVRQQQAPQEGVEGIPGADPPAAAAAPAPQGNLVDQGFVVYGFDEGADGNQQAVPIFYLGEFKVDSSTPTSVTLSPAAELNPAQLRRIASGNARLWSLYEMIPLDSHEPWLAAGSEPSDENCLGRVDEARVRALLEGKITDETLQTYLDDGRRATDDDPPLSRWWLVEFTKSHNIDVDSAEQRGVEDGPYFDGIGRAVDARLQAGGVVSFKKGDQILVKEEALPELEAEGVVERRDRYYLRPLNDYRYVLQHIKLQLVNLADVKKELESKQKMLQESIDNTQKMIVTNQGLRNKLEQDLKQFEIETQAITQYSSEVKKQLDQMRSDMIRLHQQNQALEKEIKEKHLSIEERIDALTMSE